MEKVTLNPPKGKRWVTLPHQAPFPIPIGSLIGHAPNGDEWHVFRGHIHGNSVCVVDTNHVESLAHMGFFGSSLSRRVTSCKGQSRNELPKAEKGNEVQQRLKDAQNGHNSDFKHGKVYQKEGHPMAMNTEGELEQTVEDQSTPMSKSPELLQFQNVLHLTTVEALFLSFGLGCLLVMDKNQKILNLEEMWKFFCSQDSLFVYKYIAYHHFRSKGWVVKPGIKFGTTYVLYKQGPPFYHASYSVMVKPVEGELLTSIPNIPESPITWTSLAGLNRITEHVAKELLFCYVIKPTSLKQSDLLFPACISKFEIQEILIRRWVSTEERAESEGKI